MKQPAQNTFKIHTFHSVNQTGLNLQAGIIFREQQHSKNCFARLTHSLGEKLASTREEIASSHAEVRRKGEKWEGGRSLSGVLHTASGDLLICAIV